MSIFAIGDIHGQLSLLERLLEVLPRTADDTTVFLGDYIDRGPDSAGVVQRVLAERDTAPERTVLLWGNHEDMAAAHFGFVAPSGFEYDPYDWFRNGAYDCLASWGYLTPEEAFAAPCPAELSTLVGHLRTAWRGPDNTIFVHAGILPWQEPETAPGETLLWVRGEFLSARQRDGRRVVFGHTPQKAGLPLVEVDKIGIDTGAAFGGPLTALQLPEKQIFQALPDGRTRTFPLHPPG